MPTTLWLRAETKPHERRVALTPEHASALLDRGVQVKVESSEMRCFADDDYRKVGCNIAAAGSWPDAPTDAIILGLKDLPKETTPLKHRHVYFAHAYKGQLGAENILKRFKDGGGTIIDLEYLTDENGRRLAAFGYWAGYVGAVLGVALVGHGMLHPGKPFPAIEPFEDRDAAVNWAKSCLPPQLGHEPAAIVIGALGRTGAGAGELLERVGFRVTKWDLEETKAGGPFAEILEHDLFLNCVLVADETPPFVTLDSLKTSRRLRAVSDVACDPTSPNNPLPIYKEPTTMTAPAITLDVGNPLLQLTAIDNLPTLLPRESSEDFSTQLIGYLTALVDTDATDPVSRRAKAVFSETAQKLG